MQSQNCWLHNKICLEVPPEGHYGFVYQITVQKDKSIPKELWGKVYIGKKAFTFSTKKKITKKVIKETGTRKRIERGTKDSGWQNYFGSSVKLKADLEKYGKENFKREILCFCKSKNELAYNEVKYQIQYDVLHQNSYNGWISCKIYRDKIN